MGSERLGDDELLRRMECAWADQCGSCLNVVNAELPKVLAEANRIAARLAAAEAALAVCADAIRDGVWDVLAGGAPLPTPALKNLKLALTRAESVLAALAGSREPATTTKEGA